MWVKFILEEVILLLLVLIVARPQIGSKLATSRQREGIETIIALDISNSMLAEDVSPSRLEKSKLLVENLMNKFSEDKIGLIVFAGDAFVQLPITGDYVSAKMFLDNINPSLIGTQGTDIGKALQLSINSFTPNSKVGKAIILITDGEDNEGGAEAMAKQARNKGIKVFILGIGSKEGSTIPMPDGTELKDSNGEPVKTHLNEDMCRRTAAAGQGCLVGGGVDARSHARHNGNALFTQRPAEIFGNPHRLRRGMAAADDGGGRFVQQLHVTAQKQNRRRGNTLSQHFRKILVLQQH